METIRLNNKVTMPMEGFGVFRYGRKTVSR